jgi:hypothetical protein
MPDLKGNDMTEILELKETYDTLRDALSKQHSDDSALRLRSIESQIALSHAGGLDEAEAQQEVLIDLLNDHFEIETPIEQLARSVLDVLAVSVR